MWWCHNVYLVQGFGPSLDLGTQSMNQQSTGCPENNDALGSSWNWKYQFRSNWNGMVILIRPEWNGFIPFRPEWSFQSGWNGMTSFHSGRNGELIPFWLEWNGHSIPAGMEWLHSIPAGMEWALHSGRNGHSNPAGMECHSFDNVKKYTPRTSVAWTNVP